MPPDRDFCSAKTRANVLFLNSSARFPKLFLANSKVQGGATTPGRLQVGKKCYERGPACPCWEEWSGYSVN